MKKTDGFNREGEGRHDPREDVDYYSKLNIIVSILRLYVFSYLRKGSKFIFIIRFLLEYKVCPRLQSQYLEIFIKTIFTVFLYSWLHNITQPAKLPSWELGKVRLHGPVQWTFGEILGLFTRNHGQAFCDVYSIYWVYMNVH